MYGLTERDQPLTINVAAGDSVFLRNIVGNFNLGATVGTSFITETAPGPPSLSLLLLGSGLIALRRRFGG